MVVLKTSSPKKKKKGQVKCRKNVCSVNEDILERRNKLQPQQLKDLRVLFNFKKLNEKDMENSRNFLRANVLSVIRRDRVFEEVMNVISEVIKSLDLLSPLITKGERMEVI